MGNRVFWACQAVGIAPESTDTFAMTKGVQSVGITTTFNLEQAFELGQLAIYENIENIPDVEVTLEKVLDGRPLLYHLATKGYSSSTLSGRSAKKCNVALAIFGDVQDSASGTPVAEIYMSGMYVSSLSYTIPTDGNCTESVTLVGNNKVWTTGSPAFRFDECNYLNTDTPVAISGGVQRRENIIFDRGGDSAKRVSLLPSGTGGIPGITAYGQNVKTSDVYGAHISNITINCDLGREAINELGRKGPYFRFVTFPVEVTCDIEVITLQGDGISATEVGTNSDGTNLNNQKIYLVMEDGTIFNLGSSNKLSNVTYGGGDTGGGQATVTYSYSNFNELTITNTHTDT